MTPLRRVLVANRGEIAVRIIRTLDHLGIDSVAVYSEADAGSLHVRAATEAVLLGPPPASDSYLRTDLVLSAATDTGADAIHPGYGFLSENAAFAAAVEDAGLSFLGPTSIQIHLFGDKNRARTAARAAGVPLLAGSDLLEDVESAHAAARAIGFPVMLKSSAGGGGIGMQVCRSEDDLSVAFEQVRRTATAAFGSSAVFVERYVEQARHVEVQVVGDGAGRILVLGDRDCSMQRRNQKVIEEAPAPNLSPDLRLQLHDAAHALMAAVDYRSAGTVEFVVDAERDEASFLEVNTRLQVEHPVTEATHGIDLVEWMVRIGGGDLAMFDEPVPTCRGHAIEARVYAEDPARDFRPSAGRITEVVEPTIARCDSWIERGSEVSPFYDPLLAKVIVAGSDRAQALDALRTALGEMRIGGIETNLGLLRDAVADPEFLEGRVVTSTITRVPHRPRTIEVLDGGNLTTVQDFPGRLGYWAVGVPPSGPMDARSFRLGNRIVGNAEGAPGLELTVRGPTLRFDTDSVIALTGAPMQASIDGDPVEWWRPLDVRAGSTLQLGPVIDAGCRSYLAVRGGLDVPSYLGSASTFTLGRFGGHAGRALHTGDVLHLGGEWRAAGPPKVLDADEIPTIGHDWEIGVLAGPHAAPDYFTEDDIAAFYAASWEVHFNSARTGIRLTGPRPRWARPDGGDAGLHPSNIHDVPYAVGTVDFTGDMPIILGPDGPSLGGFVCPATTAGDELWKLGQLSPGDTVRFVPRSEPGPTALPQGVLRRREADGDQPRVTYRRDGDRAVIVEYGPDELDLDLRFRVHALMTAVQDLDLPGVVDLTPGIRSIQVAADPDVLPMWRLEATLAELEDSLPAPDDLVVPSRIVHLPLSWDDPATLEATERYMQVVRPDAPWCPHNLEFIRRINGLESIDDVHRIVFDASYLVLGLGDVYLGAPVATPLDPRHRLVTTKYNPARTWTPENAVGIGGAYLCIYGMEGPGGYQFVGRTVPVWNTWRSTRYFEPGTPWLLRFFDQIRFYPVTPDELLDLRRDLLIDRTELTIEETKFSLADYHDFLATEADSIAAFRSTQQAAFADERQAWEDAGEFERVEALSTAPVADTSATADIDIPEGATLVRSPVGASVWQVPVAVGDTISADDAVVVLEAMKMEMRVAATANGTVHEILVRPGEVVTAGQPLVVIV